MNAIGYDYQTVKDRVHTLLMHYKCTRDVADAVSDVLLEAELFGVRTHGVRLLPIYITRIKNGILNPAPRIRIVCQSPGILCLDADDAPGPYSGICALKQCVEHATETGLSVVGVRNSNHFGMAGYYAFQGARQGFITVSTTNGSPAMAPSGSMEAFFAATPIAIAIPRVGKDPIVLDMALTNSARARIRQYASRDEAIPEGWALNAEGLPTTDAREALAGSLLPIGGYKGYGLAFMLEVLTAIFTGAAIGPDAGDLYESLDRPQSVGHFFFALKYDACRGEDDFDAALSDLVDRVRGSRIAPGQERILIPGERELDLRNRQLASGVMLTPEALAALNQELQAVGLDPLASPAE